MTTNNFPGVGYITKGYNNHNYFQKLSITATTFGGNTDSGQQPDCIIPFVTQGIIFSNENSSSSSTSVVEYSFDGQNVHGELDPSKPTGTITFNNRVASLIWFRVKSGSSGPITIRVDAWQIH